MSPSLDAYVPSALVHVIITEYLCPQSWATLLRTSRGERDTVALAAKVHPWSGRARLVRALVHNGTPLYASPRATLSETLAVLHHCHVAHAAGGAGGAVVVSVCETLELAVPHAGAPNEQTLRLVARGVEVRCPEASWRPWMPLALRFSSDRVQIQRTRRTAAPIPPVVELTARGARDRLALEDMAEFLHARGEVGRAPTEGCGANLPACDVFVMPRNRAIEWLEDFVAIEKRHTTMTPEEADVAALRRMAKLPPRGDPDMDTRTLWGVVVPPDESSARPSDGGALDAAPAEQLRHVAALTRAIGAGLRTS